MGGNFSTNYRESNLISRLESSRQSAWSRQLSMLGDLGDDVARKLALKLVHAGLIEVTNMRDLEEQLIVCVNDLLHAEDFEIQYAISPIRDLVDKPNRISLFVTAFIIEKLINHRAVVDVFGTDEEIYNVVNDEIMRMLK
ncbi:conserved hypothetical protein [Desulfarculus baarsii DSM 2075]|uniref:Uncharacterized protein n=1 Tax=Desulfarculus baarsii (strain ATCC 33931 / DSM 2075 / LMG 7858 / VKM B-1802 / 2st14) TaxID=644282 RepID=E1QHT8_DESB2|nr:hypothetical protein [Desulfarculus baarsii]ADK85131.1 conserved hypothetical protein [Desulfarculus baarsii DSM 2075]